MFSLDLYQPHIKWLGIESFFIMRGAQWIPLLDNRPCTVFAFVLTSVMCACRYSCSASCWCWHWSCSLHSWNYIPKVVTNGHITILEFDLVSFFQLTLIGETWRISLAKLPGAGNSSFFSVTGRSAVRICGLVWCLFHLNDAVMPTWLVLLSVILCNSYYSSECYLSDKVSYECCL